VTRAAKELTAAPRNRFSDPVNRQIDPLEFSIVANNPQVRTLSIYFSIPFFVFLACVLASFTAGVFGQQDALFMALLIAVVGGAVMWNIQQYGRGSAVMGSSELVVKTRGWIQRYNWLDVKDVLITSFAERGSTARLWARVIHWPEREPFVELKLNRALRTGFSPGRYGTRLKGIPLIGGERVALFVDEPESFVRSAKSYVYVGKSMNEPAP
jgi:hypothetical protein